MKIGQRLEVPPNASLPSLLLALSQAAVGADMQCPPMPPEMNAVKRDISVDLEASAGRLGKVAAGQVRGKLDVTAKAVFDRYPDLSKLLILQTLASTYCSALNTSGMGGKERAARWEQFMNRYLELKAAPEKVSASLSVRRSLPSQPSDANKQATQPSSVKVDSTSIKSPGEALSQEERYALYERLLERSQTSAALAGLRRLAVEGYPKAQFELGNRYLRGELGLEQSYKFAFEQFAKAATSGYAPAQHNLAVMYQDGLGTSRDEALAMTWFAAAARGGNAQSRELLGKLGRTW